MSETFLIVDNRLVQSKQAITSCDFAIQTGSSNLASLMAMVLGRLLVCSSEHRSWVPQPTLYCARNAIEVQELRHSNISEAIACISTDLKPLNTFDRGDAESGPASTWRYINSGVRNVLKCMRNKKNSEGGKVLITIFTNDSALLHTATLPTPLVPSYVVSSNMPVLMQEQVKEFKGLLTQIRSLAGKETTVELQLVIASLEGVSGRGVASNPYVPSGTRAMREEEVYELSKMLTRCNAESKPGEMAGITCTSTPPLEHLKGDGGCSVQVVAPTSLVYEDVLRNMLVFHAPSVISVLSFPSMHGITCDLDVYITAPTMRSADELAATRSGLNGDAIRILQLLPHTAVPAVCLEGGTLQLSAAPALSYAQPGRRSAYKHNLLAFTALETALRDRSSILIVRILKRPDASHIVPVEERTLSQGRLSATYWAIIPPPASSLAPLQPTDRQFGMVRLVDREHFLLEGASYETDMALPVPVVNAAAADTGSGWELDELALQQNLQTVQSYLGELGSYHGRADVPETPFDAGTSLHSRGLKALHGGTPLHPARDLYNPLSHPGGEIACQISAVERHWQEQSADILSLPPDQVQGQTRATRPAIEATFNRKRIIETAERGSVKYSARVSKTLQVDENDGDNLLSASSDETLIPVAKSARESTTGPSKRRRTTRAGTESSTSAAVVGRTAPARKKAESKSAIGRAQRYVKDTAKKRAALDSSIKPRSRLSRKGLSLVGKSEDALTDSLESVTDSGDDFWP